VSVGSSERDEVRRRRAVSVGSWDKRAGPILERLKSWLAQNNGVIMAVLLLVIGMKLIGDAISGFSS
jgi:hypothetical protein